MGGTVEIVSYNPDEEVAYVIHGEKGLVTRIPLENLYNDNLLTGTDIEIKKAVEEADKNFKYGDMTSLAYNKNIGLLAVSIQAQDYTSKGRLVFLRDNGLELKIEEIVEVVVQPDMVTFDKEGRYALVANEGEPRKGYSQEVEDPRGSISIVTLKDYGVEDLGFESFDNKVNELSQKISL